MTATSWPGAPDAANSAFGATSTADDYGRFVAMLLHRGTLDGTRVLSPAAVEEVPGGVQIQWRVVLEVEGREEPACIAETISRRYLR